MVLSFGQKVLPSASMQGWLAFIRCRHSSWRCPCRRQKLQFLLFLLELFPGLEDLHCWLFLKLLFCCCGLGAWRCCCWGLLLWPCGVNFFWRGCATASTTSSSSSGCWTGLTLEVDLVSSLDRSSIVASLTAVSRSSVSIGWRLMTRRSSGSSAARNWFSR